MSDPSNVYPDPERMLRVLGEEVSILQEAGITPFAIGSVAGAVHGEVAWPGPGSDLDLFVSEGDARRAVAVLSEHGHAAEGTHEDWLLKVRKNGVLTDLIFRAAGEIELDAERPLFRGVDLPVLSAEDYTIMQAFTHSIDTRAHWFNALGVLRRATLDWDYFLRRASLRPERALALLCWARSDGIAIPQQPMDALWEWCCARK